MIRLMRPMAMAAVMAALAGCAAGIGPKEGSSSRLGVQAMAPKAGLRQGPVYMTSQYDVADVFINVPRTLVVSEANTYHPDADIVWRGDPVSDRYVQIEAILTEAATTGTAMMTTGPKVDVEVVLLRFHGLTEKTRYSVGGVHSMHFMLTVRDDATGAIIDGPRPVIAEVKAAGGARAVAEDLAGMTQRVVVTARLARAIRFALSKPVAPPPPVGLAFVQTDPPAFPTLN